MRHGSLFSGIGGFDLAAEWCGWENVFHCEWNTFGQKVLKHHFPKSISYNDITKTDFTIHRGDIDIISGGFPCQPYSSAGKRLGKEDERHLWPEMLRAIREIQPSWVVGENVRGLTNWNGGLVFDEVQSELEAEGYEVLPFLLPAAAVNAPHRRDRIWFIAYSNCYGSNKRNSAYEIATTNGRLDALSNTNKSDGNGIATDTNSYGQQQKWGYDRSSQDVNGSDNAELRSANTKDIDRCSTNGNTKNQSKINNGTCIEGIYEKDKTSRSNGVCGMDKNIGQSKGNIGENEFKINKDRALVQEGQSRFQLSDNRGLDRVKETLSSTNGNGLQNDVPGLNRMERVTTDSNTTRIHEQHITAKSNEKKQYSRSSFEARCFSTFPTEPPICGANDGLPKELDGITFSKWRNESIKAYGNAIVPQVAYQIFKSISLYQEL